MPLREYRAKRNFSRTVEPRGQKKASGRKLAFVIQKHAATRLHYDFRLEHKGVMLSWAIPKGPSLDPRERRLAVHVEDHPLEYRKFEGTIPEGEYGGGTVMIWDYGTWQPQEPGSIDRALREGKLKVTLHGQKLNGGWMLVRLQSSRLRDNKSNWLLIKERDRWARPGDQDDILEESPESAKSGRSMEQIAAGRLAKIRQRRTVSHSKTADRRRAAKPPDLSNIRLTHPDRVLYADQGITKRDLANYYLQIADWILPHIANRPLSLVRCPAGMGGPCFFQRHPPEGLSTDVERIKIREKAKTATYLAVHDVRGLLSLVQFGALELHVWGCRADDVQRPDRLVFDLDPDPSVPWKRVIDAACVLRDKLDELNLRSFVKTSGGKGLHIVVPIARKHTWEATTAFSRAIADAVTAEHPDQFVATMSKAKRRGKIFIDYLRNQRGASTVVAYSTRASPALRFRFPYRGMNCQSSRARNTIPSKTSLASWQSVSAIRGSKCCAAVNRSL